MKRNIKNQFLPYMYILPAMLMITFVIAVPFISNLLFSLTSWTGYNLNLDFIGFKNYIEAIGDQSVIGAFMNNVKFLLLTLILQNILGLGLALILFQTKKARNFFRASFFLPTIIATVAVAFIWSLIFNPRFGFVYFLSNNLGLEFFKDFNLLGDPKFVMFGIAFTNIWQWTGWNMVVYFAGLQSVPVELLEAADIDGASRLKKLLKITIPMLAPAFTVNIVYTTIGALKMFDLPYVMTSGGPGHASETMAMYINYSAFEANRMGYGCAVSVMLFLFIITLSTIQTNYLRKAEEEVN